MQSRDLYQYAILNVFQTLTLVKYVTTWYFPSFIITALNSAKRINKPITFTCRLRLWTCKAQFLQLGSILFDKALTAAFLQKYPTWQRFAPWHNGEICQAKSTHNLSGRRAPKNEENNSIEWRKCALVNRVIGQLFWVVLGLSRVTTQ